MNILATIGQVNAMITYVDRPTVKIIIKKDDTILLLNDGLLPGGGIDDLELENDAITRELQEELGMTVRDAEELGTVIQYRNFLKRRYVVNGYVATLDSAGGVPNPQDTGEAQFAQTWLGVDDALRLVSRSISIAKAKPMNDDIHQGRLYNLMTTYELLKRLT